MKILVPMLVLAATATVFGQKIEDKPQTSPAAENPPVVQAPPPPVAPPAQPTYEYEQKLPPAPGPLVTSEQAQGILDKFKETYSKLGNPRMVVYVNRDLVDENSGLKLTARNEKVDSSTTGSGKGETSADATTTENISRENRYRNTDRKEMTLSDRQTVRDIERLFGRPFRMAGVRLADQHLATQLMPDRPLKSLAIEGEQARKDREALAKIGDIAVEILVSSKKSEGASISGIHPYEAPDIQVTALRLSDSEIIGQASSSDVLRFVNPRNYDVRAVTEAVALALMEDMAPATAGK
jgi:hypothetical protein